MKTIDEIEKLTMEDLERISLDDSLKIPEGLEDRIKASVQEPGAIRRKAFWLAGAAASVVLVAALALTLRPSPLKDTFDDPALAYAEVEKALVSFSEVINSQINNISK